MQKAITHSYDAYGLGRGIKTEIVTHSATGTLSARVVVEERDEHQGDVSLLRAQALARGMRARIGVPVRAQVRTATADSPAALIMEMALGVDGMDFQTLRFVLRRIERVAASMVVQRERARGEIQRGHLHV